MRKVRVYGGGDAEGRFWEVHEMSDWHQFRTAGRAMDYLREIHFTEAEAKDYARWEAPRIGEQEEVTVDRAECMWAEIRTAVEAEL